MQKNVVIKLRLETATGRNILAGVLKGIRDKDNCAINIASDDDGFMRLAERASAIVADTSANVATIQKAIADGKALPPFRPCCASQSRRSSAQSKTAASAA